ncbi:hypothetical protein F66182_9689 [Fusarium sp. NRRL 66182]|nr:hypothetical protein F66182_9689 [Fusarium sp. NRRL 66182]
MATGTLKNIFPPEIETYIIERLMLLHSTGSTDRRSSYACVSKRWQWVVEGEIFSHFVLHPDDVPRFERIDSPRRRKRIKHIIVEIPIKDADEDPSPDYARTNKANNTAFTWALLRL